jgi:hypothetical protein
MSVDEIFIENMAERIAKLEEELTEARALLMYCMQIIGSGDGEDHYHLFKDLMKYNEEHRGCGDSTERRNT